MHPSSCGYSYSAQTKGKSLIRKGLFSSLFCLICCPTLLYAQQRMSAHVTSRQVANHRSIRIERQLYYTVGGDLVIHYTYPQEYYMKSNRLGEVTLYQPASNEVTLLNDKDMAAQSEVFLVFLSPDRANLNLTRMGFVLQKVEKQGQRVVKTYTPTQLEDKIYSKAVVALENNQPIYCAFYDQSANIVRKTFYSQYTTLPALSFPTRITQIAYNGVGDSTVRREEYKDIKTSGFPANAPFDFQIPASARRVTLFETKP